MKNITVIAIILALTSSCFPENMGKEMGNALGKMQQMLADQNFKRAISHIELYKIRHGKYPPSIDSLEFINPMDSSFLRSVEYIPMDSVYGLNLTHYSSRMKTDLSYPDEFWEGLGCSESNMK